MFSSAKVSKPFLLTCVPLLLFLLTSLLLVSQIYRFLGIENVQNKSRVAIVYLAGSAKRDIRDLNCSLKSLQANFNDRYGYRVIVQHEDLGDVIRNDLSARYPVEFKTVNLELDDSLNKTYGYLTKPTMSKRSKWGYQSMCRFWFTRIFRNSSILEGLEYYLRLDTDSTLTENIEHDFIREFIEGGISYGHHVVARDCGDVVRGLPEFVFSYVKSGVQLADRSQWKIVSKWVRKSRCVPLFYNNLEFVDIRRFREDENIRKWEVAVDKNGGIYRYRWGDAPLRYLTVTMFFKDHEFKPLKLKGYRHKFKPKICAEQRKNFA